MVSKADLVSTSSAPLTRRSSELSRAQNRRERHRRRTLSSLAVLSVAGLVAAYVGPLGSLGSSADAAEPSAVSQYATTVHDAQTYDSPLSADISLGRDAFSYSVYVKPKPTPTPTVIAAAANRQGSTALQVPMVAPDPGSAQAIAYGMVAARGWGDGEFACLVALWNRESGWRVNAHNRSSGAYGIPQALPGGKMASAGADWQTNPATQIAWGLGYISGRYGSPCGAWGHSQARGWY